MASAYRPIHSDGTNLPAGMDGGHGPAIRPVVLLDGHRRLQRRRGWQVRASQHHGRHVRGRPLHRHGHHRWRISMLTTTLTVGNQRDGIKLSGMIDNFMTGSVSRDWTVKLMVDGNAGTIVVDGPGRRTLVVLVERLWPATVLPHSQLNGPWAALPRKPRASGIPRVLSSEFRSSYYLHDSRCRDRHVRRRRRPRSLAWGLRRQQGYGRVTHS